MCQQGADARYQWTDAHTPIASHCTSEHDNPIHHQEGVGSSYHGTIMNREGGIMPALEHANNCFNSTCRDANTGYSCLRALFHGSADAMVTVTGASSQES